MASVLFCDGGGKWRTHTWNAWILVACLRAYGRSDGSWNFGYRDINDFRFAEVILLEKHAGKKNSSNGRSFWAVGTMKVPRWKWKLPKIAAAKAARFLMHQESDTYLINLKNLKGSDWSIFLIQLITKDDYCCNI